MGQTHKATFHIEEACLGLRRAQVYANQILFSQEVPLR